MFTSFRKFLVLLMALVGFAADAPARETTPPEGPRIEVSTMEIDLGTVKPADGPPQVVEVRNAGTGTLEVTNIAPLCTCVDVNSVSLSVAPGATQSFTILPTLSTYPANDIKGKVRLYTNDPTRPELDITVRGAIAPEYIIEPAKIDFGTVKGGDTVTRTFIVRPANGQPLTVERVEASRGLTATLKEKYAKKEEKETERPSGPREVVVTLPGDAPPGPFQGTVTVFTDCRRMPRAEVKVSGKVAGLAYSVTPRVLAFGTAAPGAVLGAFVIEGKGIRVTDAQADQPGLVLRVVEVVAGSTYRVEVAAGEDSKPGNLLRVVSIHIGDALQSDEIRVRVFVRIE